jgi:aspartate kinase
VTGFLGKGVQTGAITTLGRGGSDFSATVLGAAMELRELQVRFSYTTIVCQCM